MASGAVRITRNFSLRDPQLVTRDDLRAAGEHALLLIRERTAKGLDAKGQRFTPYSPEYAEAKGAYAFGAVASARTVTLELTGAMLANMAVVDVDETKGLIVLGFAR